MVKRALTFILISKLIFAETILAVGEREYSDIDSMPSNDVEDTLTLSQQDISEFAEQSQYMSREEQLYYDAKYNELFFKPWDVSSIDLSDGEKYWQFMYARHKMYRRDGSKIPKAWFQKQIKESNFDAYGSVNRAGVIVRHTDIKLYPTDEEFYYNVNRTGEGFPFDYNQNSSIYINTPIFISHYSRDGEWAYIKAPFAFGWVKMSDVAFVQMS